MIKNAPLSDIQKAAIVYHDTAKRDFGADNHGANGAKIAQQQLKSLYTPQDVRRIAIAIRQHNLDQRVKDQTTMQQTISNFDNSQGELLAIADDMRPMAADATWKKTMKYNFKYTPDRTPQQILQHMKTRLDPRKRMPQLLTYKKQFEEVNKPFIDWLDGITLDDVKTNMDKYRNANTSE